MTTRQSEVGRFSPATYSVKEVEDFLSAGLHGRWAVVRTTTESSLAVDLKAGDTFGLDAVGLYHFYGTQVFRICPTGKTKGQWGQSVEVDIRLPISKKQEEEWKAIAAPLAARYKQYSEKTKKYIKALTAGDRDVEPPAYLEEARHERAFLAPKSDLYFGDKRSEGRSYEPTRVGTKTPRRVWHRRHGTTDDCFLRWKHRDDAADREEHRGVPGVVRRARGHGRQSVGCPCLYARRMGEVQEVVSDDVSSRGAGRERR